MAEPEVAKKLRSLFACEDRKAKGHTQHVLSMQESGQWGTEQEIAAAAHLLNCFIVCFLKYSNKQFCRQHFPTFHRFQPMHEDLPTHHNISHQQSRYTL